MAQFGDWNKPQPTKPLINMVDPNSKEAKDIDKAIEKKKAEQKAVEQQGKKPEGGKTTEPKKSNDRDLGDNFNPNEEKELAARKGKKYDTKNMFADISKMRSTESGITNRKLLESYAVKSAIYGIGGMPATFLKSVDPPLPGQTDGLGYQYIQNVIRYGTFVAFQPGFITWSLDLDQVDLSNIFNPQNVDYLQKKIIGGGIDYNQPKLKEYYMEVSRHWRLANLLMGTEHLGLDAMSFGTTGKSNAYGKGLSVTAPKLSTFSFSNFTHQDIANLGLGLADAVISGIPSITVSKDNRPGEESSGFVVFYVNGAIEASDTISNESEPSVFKTAANELLGDTSSMLKELMGKTLGAFDGGNALLTFLGGNAVIPDVWKDTSYPKSYQMSILLSSCSGDPVSRNMNIIYPLIKLICLATPLGTGGFYSSAPILRVFSQGVINTEYGLIENMTITRKMETLNDYGMPNEVEVQLTVKDLNPYIYREMPGWFKSGMLVSSSMSVFLATICGVNVTTLNRSQKLIANNRLWEEYKKNEGTFKNILDRKFQSWADIGTNWSYGMQEKAQNLRIGVARVGDILKSAPRDIKDRVFSAPKVITGASDAVGNTVNALTGANVAPKVTQPMRSSSNKIKSTNA